MNIQTDGQTERLKVNMFDEPLCKTDRESSFPALSKKSNRRESYIKKNIKCIRRESIPNYNATLKPKDAPSLTSQLGLKLVKTKQSSFKTPTLSPQTT